MFCISVQPNSVVFLQDESYALIAEKIQDMKQRSDTPEQGKDNSGMGDDKDDGKMACYY